MSARRAGASHRYVRERSQVVDRVAIAIKIRGELAVFHAGIDRYGLRVPVQFHMAHVEK